MPPAKKKAKPTPPPVPCFAGLSVQIVGATKGQRTIWEAKVGPGVAFVTAADVKPGADYVVVTGAIDTALHADISARAAAANLVTEGWLTRSISQRALEPWGAYAWRAPTAPPPAPVPEEALVVEEDGVLPKFACQRRITLADDKNPQLTGWLKQQLKWWQRGVLDADDKKEYAQRVALVGRVLSLIRSWPVKLTTENWEEERYKLAKQHYISAQSVSAEGGWLTYLSQLIEDGPEGLIRHDAFSKWAKDPVRVSVKEVKELNMRVTQKQALNLAKQHGVTGAKDLVARRHTLCEAGHISESLRDFLAWSPTGSDEFPNSGTPMDVAETTQIHEICAAAARALGLTATPVGSWRRGHVGGHDVDILLHDAKNYVTIAEYDYRDRQGKGHALMARFFDELTKAAPPGFRLPYLSSGGEKYSGDKKATPKLSTIHTFVMSPTVPGAVRRLDVCLAPSEIYAHALMGWSGTTSFQRSFAEYVNSCHQKNWVNVPDRKPVVGRSGWNMLPNGQRGDRVEGRELLKKEHWSWSKHGVYIATGSHSGAEDDHLITYAEDNKSLLTEEAIFSFFHLTYLHPREREA